jgi:hypothetical protein
MTQCHPGASERSEKDRTRQATERRPRSASALPRARATRPCSSATRLRSVARCMPPGRLAPGAGPRSHGDHKPDFAHPSCPPQPLVARERSRSGGYRCGSSLHKRTSRINCEQERRSAGARYLSGRQASFRATADRTSRGMVGHARAADRPIRGRPACNIQASQPRSRPTARLWSPLRVIGPDDGNRPQADQKRKPSASRIDGRQRRR